MKIFIRIRSALQFIGYAGLPCITLFYLVVTKRSAVREQPGGETWRSCVTCAVGRPGRVFGTRELVIERYPYIVPYRIQGNAVQLLRVFHTSRKPPKTWQDVNEKGR